jgi:hypothetical protein
VFDKYVYKLILKENKIFFKSSTYTYNFIKNNAMPQTFLSSAISQFQYYKALGEKTFSQLKDGQLFWQYNEESNSIATIVKHLAGNMISRWTDFLTTDGEKENRNRDAEFENDVKTRDALLALWEKGWTCLFEALSSITDNDLEKEIFIRNQGHTITEAINRQLAHYPYHVGQIVFMGKMMCDKNWNSLSIPKGNSKQYNEEKFAKPKHREHFTNEYIDKSK